MRRALLAAISALITLAAWAQPFNTREEVMANIDLAGGTYSLYPTGQPSPARPPKGYKPFYLTHMGRHGARYVASSTTYERVWTALDSAHRQGNLTPEGEKIYKAYAGILPNLRHREGVLTKKGQAQHRQIASQIYRDFPALFKGKTKAQALSTTSHRVLLSMMCFLDQMKQMDPDFTFEADYGYRYYPVLVPESHNNPAFVERAPFPEDVLKAYDSFAAEVLDEDALLRRWFLDPEKMGSARESFIYRISRIVSDFSNLDFPVSDTLKAVFTDDERYRMWQVQNYSDYIYTSRAPGVDQRRCLEMSVTVKDIIDRFDDDLRDGVAMRLRFSHDTAMMPLLSYLGVNGKDVSEADPRKLENLWRNFDICMACNFQMVFFRNKKNPDDILVQVLLNGFQATLPLPEAAPGFYHWSDFKEKFNHLEI
ncbi:MAG: hypothetical protein IKR38_01790 [Bacteroidales bacterium]|nr:hypothetical protein [Bacteroidales bacterium]